MTGSESVVQLEVLNRDAKLDAKKFVTNCEKLYINQIKEVANLIKYRAEKIVLISGPSSAGKTTTSFKLQKELEKLGTFSHVLNMDDFFIDQDKVKLRPDGKPDFEDLDALDVPCIQKCLSEILEKGETKTPQFDFIKHVRKKKWVTCKLEKNEIIIMEGIHALNPKIVKGLDMDRIFKLYLDCETDFSYKDKVILSAKELRLLRRIIRDERDRAVPVEKTLEMWEEVCKGEEKNIKPYMNTANYKINTVHYYEPLLYKTLFKETLKSLGRIKQLKVYKNAFKHCETLNIEDVSGASLIREFIGKKAFENK